jgi:hypothetical protein
MLHIMKSTKSQSVPIIVVLVGLMICLFSPIYVLFSIVGALLLLYVLNKPERSIFICMFLYFIPICMGKYFGESTPVSYFVIPTITVLYLLLKIMQKTPIYSFRWSLNPLLIPTLIYFGVVFASFLRNPIFPSDIPKLRYESLGIHAWMAYLLSFCYYFIFTEVIATNARITKTSLKLLWQFSLILSVLGIVLVYSHTAQNVLYNLQNRGIVSEFLFDTGGTNLLETRYRDPAVGVPHIGTLSGAAAMGLFLLLTVRSKILLNWVLGIFLGYALILSGMRSAFAGTVIALVVWLLIKRKPKYVLVSLVILIALYLGIFVFYENLPGFFQRTFRIRGSFQELDIGRARAFSSFWRSFFYHPLFGVGIGHSGFRYSSDWLTFFGSEQLRRGGHGTYLSLLYLFGLMGFIPFMIALIKGINSSYELSLKTDSELDQSFAMFCLLFLVYYTIPMAFGGAGRDPFCFAIMGTISGLYIKRRKDLRRCQQQT